MDMIAGTRGVQSQRVLPLGRAPRRVQLFGAQGASRIHACGTQGRSKRRQYGDSEHHRLKHSDGRQLQRVGLVPDIEVMPTIHGIQSGRDELLDAAIDYLNRP